MAFPDQNATVTFLGPPWLEAEVKEIRMGHKVLLNFCVNWDISGVNFLQEMEAVTDICGKPLEKERSEPQNGLG